MKVHELFEVKEKSILSVMGKQDDHFIGNFRCSKKSLTSLEGAPRIVTSGGFQCAENRLTSLKGGPTSVSALFSCCENRITSLEGAPYFVGGSFYCHNNKLTSLHNIHKQIKHIGAIANFVSNPIISCVLGLLLIDGLKEIFLDNQKVQVIMYKHLHGGRDIFACQEELIENGFEDFAQL